MIGREVREERKAKVREERKARERVELWHWLVSSGKDRILARADEKCFR